MDSLLRIYVISWNERAWILVVNREIVVGVGLFTGFVEKNAEHYPPYPLIKLGVYCHG